MASPANRKHPLKAALLEQDMATAAKLIPATVLLLLLLKANCQRCDLSSVVVLVTNMGRKARYDPVFEVEIKNTCHCTVTNVFLWSRGFASSMALNPRLFRRAGTDYIINDGKGIGSSQSVKFRYAWDRAFKMGPSAFQVSC